MKKKARKSGGRVVGREEDAFRPNGRTMALIKPDVAKYCFPSDRRIHANLFLFRKMSAISVFLNSPSVSRATFIFFELRKINCSHTINCVTRMDRSFVFDLIIKWRNWDGFASNKRCINTCVRPSIYASDMFHKNTSIYLILPIKVDKIPLFAWNWLL